MLDLGSNGTTGWLHIQPLLTLRSEDAGRMADENSNTLTTVEYARRFRHTIDPIARFWSRVDKSVTPDCWIWTGTVDRCGYGQLSVNGTVVRAHRFSWEMHHGRSFPEGMHGCHVCDTPGCVNPLHIFPGTRFDNMQDSVQKGRAAKYNSAKTHCPSGHEYSADNTHVSAKGRRVCLTCRTRNRRAFEARNKARTGRTRG